MKKNILDRAWRVAVFAAVVFISFVYVPIPSSMTPSAKNEINEKANLLSSKLTEVGFNGVNMDPDAFARREGPNVSFSFRGVNPVGITYFADNIVAVAMRIFIIVAAYALLFSGGTFKRRILAICLVPAIFAALFILRDVFFGILVSLVKSNNFVPYLDNPLRLLLLSPMVFPLLQGEKQKGTDK